MAELQAAEHFITALGFPIFVACVLLFQTLHMHAENHRMISELARQVGKMEQAVSALNALLMRASELKIVVQDR